MSKFTKLYQHPLLYFIDAYKKKRGLPSTNGPYRIPDYRTPAWYTSEASEQLALALTQPNPVYLFQAGTWEESSGAAHLMEALANDGLVFSLSISTQPKTRSSFNALATFARDNPLLYRQLLAQYLRPLQGKIAGVIFARDNTPLTKPVANLCELLGIPRILIPMESYRGDPERYYRCSITGACLPTADFVIGPQGIQKQVLLNRGYPEARYFELSPLPEYAGKEKGADSQLIQKLLGACLRDGDRLVVLDIRQDAHAHRPGQVSPRLSASVIRAVFTALFEVISGRSNVSLAVLAADDQLLGQKLSRQVCLAPQITFFDESSCPVASHELLSIASVLVALDPDTVIRTNHAHTIFVGDAMEALGDPICCLASSKVSALPDLVHRALDAPPPGFKSDSTDSVDWDIHGPAIRNALLSIRENGELRPSMLERFFSGEAIDGIATHNHGSAWSGTQRYMPELLSAQSRSTTGLAWDNIDLVSCADVFVMWGIKPTRSKAYLRAIAQRLGRPVIVAEDGFIRSVDIGLSGEPGLSIILDDSTAYYDATQVSRLQRLLESGPELNIAQREESRRSIRKIVEYRVSKYNHAPDFRPDVGTSGRPKILLIDQRYGDQSIVSGLADETTFERMLQDALARKDFDVIIKQHPDAIKGGKSSYFSDERVAFTKTIDRVHCIRYDVNPYALLDMVDEVYVATSGMGFEALMAGKPVHCYGMPFYAGWGATKDKQQVSGRTRRRSMEDIFYFSYIALSRYYRPDTGQLASVEEMVEYIAERREK